MTREETSRRWWQILGPDFPYLQLVAGALIPIAIFYIFTRFDEALILILAPIYLPLEAFLIVKALTGVPVTMLLIFISWRFLAWNRAKEPTAT